MTQTWIWGINVGESQIFLANGTYNEHVIFAAPIGLPKNASFAGAAVGLLHVIGNDSSPSSVIVSAPNGSCANGSSFNSGTLDFVGAGNYSIHGFTVTAQNETTNVCSDISMSSGVTLFMDTGTINLGTVNMAAAQILVFANASVSAETGVINVAGGGTPSCFVFLGGGNFAMDSATINFASPSGPYSKGVWCTDQVGTFTGPDEATITGTVSGNCYFLFGQQSYVEGNSGTMNIAPFPGCTAASGSFVEGANIDGAINPIALGTRNLQSAPTVSTCGTSPSITTQATDTSGTVTLGSGSPTSCTVAFHNPAQFQPDVLISQGTATLTTSSSGGVCGTVPTPCYTGFTASALTGTKFTYMSLFHY